MINMFIASLNSSFIKDSDPVTGIELGRRIGLAINEIGNVLNSIIIPIAFIFFAISIFFMIVGSVSKQGTLKKLGYSMFIFISLGIIIYFITPLIVGFIRNITIILNGE